MRRREALSRPLTDARLEIDNSIAESAMRGIAVRRKNDLFSGSCGRRAASIYIVVQPDRRHWLSRLPL
jgi:hypothetical protein